MQKKITVKKHNDAEILSEKNILDESIISVGNNPSATLELKDSEIAPEQFVIISENEQVLLLNRANGTNLNGEILDLGSKIELVLDDEIKIGKFHLSIAELIEPEINNPRKEAENKEKESEVIVESDKNADDFSKVLNNLKEEDSFYFQISTDENTFERIVFDSDEIWLGTKFSEYSIKKNKEELDEIYAYVKKDWSGAVIYPEESEELTLNGKQLKEVTRLKNDDEIILIDDFGEEDELNSKITFFEPVVLLALNSILPEDIPEPISLKIKDKEKDSIEESEIQNSTSDSTIDEKNEKKNKRTRKAFGYFSFLEVLIMAFGTMVTAAIIFLALEIV